MSIKDNFLSLRLQAIYELIQDGKSVSDIGTDHAYLPIALALSKKSPTIYAVDNKKGPLSQAQKMVDFYGVSDLVRCTLVNDNHPYHDVEVWVIAGMGFEAVKGIITTYFSTIKKLDKIIVQVNHQVIEFREFCMHNQLEILDEIVVEDIYFYPIMVLQYKDNPVFYSEEELVVGPHLQHKHNETQQRYYLQKKEHILQLLEQIPVSNPRYKLLNEYVSYYNNVLKSS